MEACERAQLGRERRMEGHCGQGNAGRMKDTVCQGREGGCESRDAPEYDMNVERRIQTRFFLFIYLLLLLLLRRRSRTKK